jgi:FtsH-binding integral membrane protein
MKYFWSIIGLIVCVFLAINADNKLFAWIGIPFFLTITVVNIVRVFRKPKNK